MQTLNIGSLLQHGTYRIERVLGQGGFGITYLATDLNLQRYVAVKEFFPKDFCDRDETTSHVTLGTKNTTELVNRLKAKFLKEARNIARFDHPNIIRIYAAFEENNTAYYVMDYIEGESLSAMVKHKGPLSEREALGYIEKVGSALEYVHARKINHLDVKPANIMVRKADGTPILIDFGLSKQYDSEGNQTSTMPPGFSHGFAPMEQYNEGGVKNFSPQTDLYSLAATLYYLLSGVVPPQATRLIEEQLTFPATIPSYLLSPITKAMSTARRARHESIGDFLEEIKGEPVTEIKVEASNVSTGQNTGYQSASKAPSENKRTSNTKPDKPASQQKPSPSKQANSSQKSNTKWYYIGGGIAVIAIVLFFVLKDSGKSPNNPDSVNPTEQTTDSVAKKVNGIYYKSSLGACSYTGEVDVDGKPHGKGKAEWESGLGKSYDGQWVHGEMDGDCTYLSRSGYQFIGKFKNGHYAEGKLIAPDKSYYHGTFDNEGNKWTGTEYDANGHQTDTWKNGE